MGEIGTCHGTGRPVGIGQTVVAVADEVIAAWDAALGSGSGGAATVAGTSAGGSAGAVGSKLCAAHAGDADVAAVVGVADADAVGAAGE